jgi:hypothetical protein
MMDSELENSMRKHGVAEKSRIWSPPNSPIRRIWAGLFENFRMKSNRKAQNGKLLDE